MTDKELRLKALTRLAIATREKPEAATYAVYLDDTAGFSTAVLESACHRLERSASWFPKVAELIAECRLVADDIQRRRDEQKRLKAYRPPHNPDLMRKIAEDVRKMVRAKSMSPDRRPE